MIFKILVVTLMGQVMTMDCPTIVYFGDLALKLPQFWIKLGFDNGMEHLNSELIFRKRRCLEELLKNLMHNKYNF